jgi:hypothetical protein
MCTWCAGAVGPAAFLPLPGDEAFGLAAQPRQSGDVRGVQSPGLTESVRYPAKAEDTERVIVLPLERPLRPRPVRPEQSPPPPEPSESDDDDDPPPSAA